MDQAFHCKKRAHRYQQPGAGQTHDDARQQHAAHAGNEHIFKFHIQDGARQRTGPGTCLLYTSCLTDGFQGVGIGLQALQTQRLIVCDLHLVAACYRLGGRCV